MQNKLLMSVLLSSFACAGFAMPRDPVNHPNLFEIELTAGAFEIDTSDTVYGYIDPSLSDVKILKNRPKYQFGGSAQLSYYFSDSTINVDVSYTGARARVSDSSSGTIISEFIYMGGNANTEVEASYRFNYDFANLEIGSLTKINQNGLVLNPQIGLSFGRLKSHQDTHFTKSINDGVLFENSHFNGIGPSIGLNMDFGLGDAIHLSGNLRYSALIGNMDCDLYTESADPVSIETHNKNVVVSLIQSELALGLDLDIFKLPCTNLAIGYQITKAFDAVDHFGYILDDAFSNKAIHGAFIRLRKMF